MFYGAKNVPRRECNISKKKLYFDLIFGLALHFTCGKQRSFPDILISTSSTQGLSSPAATRLQVSSSPVPAEFRHVLEELFVALQLLVLVFVQVTGVVRGRRRRRL